MRTRRKVTFSLVALILGFSIYLNYQLVARFNFIVGKALLMAYMKLQRVMRQISLRDDGRRVLFKDGIGAK